MAKQYAWRAQTQIINGSFPPGFIGPPSSDTGWNTTDSTSGSNTTTYFYTDTNSATPDINNSSRVSITATTNWEARIDGKNNLTVTVRVNLDKIARGNIVGNPLAGGTWGRDIQVWDYKGGTRYFWDSGDNIGVAKTLATNISMGSRTFTLAPGEDATRSTIYIWNHTNGFPETGTYIDEFAAGVFFKNILPADYRPGYTIANAQNLSHNRLNGNAIVKSPTEWLEMRTYDGATGIGNPPIIKHNTGWKNMREVGIE